MAAELEVDLASDLSEIGRLAERIERFGETNGLPAKAVFNLNLALDELITNIVAYAFPDGDPGRHGLRVRVMLDDDGLTTELWDGGRPYDPFTEAPAPDLDTGIDARRVGGLGVHLVKTLIDEVSYVRDGDRNRVTLRQHL
jgi:anti-sigma regulatory factor (Ser/Thr protein kinase)